MECSHILKQCSRVPQEIYSVTSDGKNEMKVTTINDALQTLKEVRLKKSGMTAQR